MRMTDWVRQHASEMGVTVYGTGCTQKITVYSKKFAEKGGFQNDIGDAFSASPSDVYTEKWNVWIIGTSNNGLGQLRHEELGLCGGKSCIQLPLRRAGRAGEDCLCLLLLFGDRR